MNLALVAPYDTVQLTATPLTLAGSPVLGASSATFHATDSSVTVNSAGLVTARFATLGQPTQVTVWVTAQGVTLKDTVFLQITPTPPPYALTTFSIQPAPGDSAKRTIDSTGFTWPVTARDANPDATQDTICNINACSLQVYYTSSDSSVATIGRATGIVQPNDTGHVVFIATTLAYGVAKRDSVVFTVGYKLSYTVEITLAMLLGVLTLGFAAPKKLILGVGAVVTFCSKSPQPVDVVFDHPAGVDTASCQSGGNVFGPPTDSGNIVAFGGDTTSNYNNIPYTNLNDCQSRRFLTPGIYHYHSTLFPSDTYEIDIQQQR